MISPIVSSGWLNENLDNPDLILLDASQPSNTTDDKHEQIRGARVFDIKNNFSDKSSNFPNTFPSEEQFENECQKLGIHGSSIIVVYDSKGIYTSPRVWWMFKTMGHNNIAVLDGGFPDWKSKGFQTENRVEKKYTEGDFIAKLIPNRVRRIDFIKENLNKNESVVVDARSSDRFNSLVPEPRVELRRGNIPNSINIPFQDVLKNRLFKSKEELKAVFSKEDLVNKRLVFSCGSGITACIVLLATDLVFEADKSVYDGSWTEWAQLED